MKIIINILKFLLYFFNFIVLVQLFSIVIIFPLFIEFNIFNTSVVEKINQKYEHKYKIITGMYSDGDSGGITYLMLPKYIVGKPVKITIYYQKKEEMNIEEEDIYSALLTILTIIYAFYLIILFVRKHVRRISRE